MAYITHADFTKVISPTELDDIIDGDPTLLDESILVAESQSLGSLSRYDTDVAFALTGSSREPILVVRLCDVALYHMYSKVSPRNVPELRAKRYAEAVKFFEAVGSSKFNFQSFKLKQDSKQKQSYLKWGSASTDNGYDFFAF